MCTSILQCLQADKLRATKFSRLSFSSCTYEIVAFFAECSLRYLIKIGGKTSVFERQINVSNEKRSELRFCSKSMFIVISSGKLCVQSWQSKGICQNGQIIFVNTKFSYAFFFAEIVQLVFVIVIVRKY